LGFSARFIFYELFNVYVARDFEKVASRAGGLKNRSGKRSIALLPFYIFNIRAENLSVFIQQTGKE
jgi:hypothetical protein